MRVRNTNLERFVEGYFMTDLSIRKNLSVSRRLWTLGGAAFIGFGAMLAIGRFENMQVDAEASSEVRRQIGEDVLRIGEHVKSIVISAREQSVGLNEINTAISQMDQVTQKNAAMVEETNAVSHTLATNAKTPTNWSRNSRSARA